MSWLIDYVWGKWKDVQIWFCGRVGEQTCGVFHCLLLRAAEGVMCTLKHFSSLLTVIKSARGAYHHSAFRER